MVTADGLKLMQGDPHHAQDHGYKYKAGRARTCQKGRKNRCAGPNRYVEPGMRSTRFAVKYA